MKILDRYVVRLLSPYPWIAEVNRRALLGTVRCDYNSSQHALATCVATAHGGLPWHNGAT